MDTVDTVTIRAQLINELSAGVTAAKGELEALAATVKKLDETGRVASDRGLAQIGKNMSEVTRIGKTFGQGIDDLVDKIGSKLYNAAQRGVEALAALTAGAVAWGVKTAATFQQSELSIDTFLGSATAGARVFQQLKSLIGPFSIGDLTEGFQSLATSGAPEQTIVPLLKSIADISAVQVDPGAAFQGISSGVMRILETGMIESRTLLAFIRNGVDAYGLLSQEMGVPREAVKKMLSAGANITAPDSFLSDVASESGVLAKFRGGLAKERQTLGGEYQQIKAQVAQVLAAGVQPLTDWLGKQTPKITAWLDGVKARIGTYGPALAQAWSGGNAHMAGFDLSMILFGNDKHTGDFESLAKGIQGFANIVKNDIIPLGKDLLAVAIPALKGLADVLSFLGEHKGIVEALLITFGGFLAIAKVSMVLTNLAGGFAALRGAIGEGGFLLTALNFLRGMLGLEAVAGPASAAAGAAGGIGGGAAAGAAGLGLVRGVAGVAGGGFLAAQGLKGKGIGSDLELVGGGALAGAGIGSIVPVVGTAAGAAVGALAGGLVDVAKHLWGNKSGGTPTTVIVHPGAIVVNGSGDPQATANAIPKALQDQIDAYNLQAAERGQTQP